MIGAAVCALIGHRWSWRPGAHWLIQHATCTRCNRKEEWNLSGPRTVR